MYSCMHVCYACMFVYMYMCMSVVLLLNFASPSVGAGCVHVATQHDVVYSLSGECYQVSLLKTFDTFMKYLVLKA